MTRLILIRHGQSETNLERAFTGQKDVGLSETGIEQAKRAALYCSRRFPEISAVYTSDLKRAADTARPLAEMLALPLIERKDLREICVPAWQGMRFKDIEEKYPEESKVWFDNIGAFRGPDGESMREAAKRAIRELRVICAEHPDETVAVITHVTLIRAMQTLWSGGTLLDMKDTPFVVNASVTVARYEDGNFTLEEAGTCEHLDGLITHMPGRE